MITVQLSLKATREPLKRVPVVLQLDADQSTTEAVLTDRAGQARFELPPASGKVLVSGIERYHGHLDEGIRIELWSIAQGDDSQGAVGDGMGGSVEYPGMQTRTLEVNGAPVRTDSEGYLVQPGDWSEGFARAQAASEGLSLSDEHWEVIRFLRRYYAERGVQAPVRDMVKHFRGAWGPERGSSRYLHRLFPVGGPQKQGNRLAGLLRTKGEH